MKKSTFLIGFSILALINILSSSYLYSTEVFFDQNYQSNKLTDSILYLYCDSSTITIRPYTDDIIKVHLHPDNIILPDTSYIVILKPEKVKFNFKEYSDWLEFSTKTVTIQIKKSPLKFKFIRDGKVVLEDKQGFFRSGPGKGVTFKLDSNEAFYGTGSHAIPINRNGYSLILYNQNPFGYSWGQSWLNTNVPFLLSSSMYGLYFDNYSLSYCDFGFLNKEVLQFNVEYGDFSYFFIGGSSYSEILNNYAGLTGYQHLPPRWSLGYLQSKCCYMTTDEVMDVVHEMRKEEFPMDAIIFDLSWFGHTVDMGNFEWYLPRYPEPTKLIKDLNEIGVKSVLISEPYIDTNSKNYHYTLDNKLLTPDTLGNIPTVNILGSPKALLDIFKPSTKDWLWSKYKPRTSEGVAGWWCDLGEPDYHGFTWIHYLGFGRNVHNIYCLFWYKTLFENFRSDFSEIRPFFLTRANWAGCQRYGAIPVCGDEWRCYPSLKAMIPVILGTGMSGLAYMHSDAGGYAGIEEMDPEIYTRWLQLGSFSPIFRVHLSVPPPAEPIYWPDNVKKIIREVINLRYHFLPYNYNLCWENSTYGIPLARQLDFYEYQNPKLRNNNDEYFWGEDILVAPVVDSAARKRDVILPKGKWVDFWDEKKYDGGQTVNIAAPIERIPLFIQAGSFISMAPKMLTTQFYKYDSLIVKYYPDINNAQTADSIYIDDGTTPDADKLGLFEFIKFIGNVKSNSIEINLSKSGQGYPASPQNRDIAFDIRKIHFKPGTFRINNHFTVIVKTITEFYNLLPVSYYNNQDNSFHIHLNWDGSDTKIFISDMISDTTNSDRLSTTKIKINNIFPNPSAEKFIVDFDILIPGKFQLYIYSYIGEIVKTYDIDNYEPSNYEIDWDGTDDDGKSVSQGVYRCVLSGEGELNEKQIILKR